MDGFIDVHYARDESYFEARCSCGWCGGSAASIEWTELSLLGHFDRVHPEKVL